jgi:hypothetical protein
MVAVTVFELSPQLPFTLAHTVTVYTSPALINSPKAVFNKRLPICMGSGPPYGDDEIEKPSPVILSVV